MSDYQKKGHYTQKITLEIKSKILANINNMNKIKTLSIHKHIYKAKE